MVDAIKTRMLNIGELVQLSASVYRKNFKLILFTGLLVYVPYDIVMSMMPAISPSDIENFYRTGRFDMDWRYILAMMAMSVCVLPLVTAAATAIANSGAEGIELRPEHVLDATLGRWWKIILTSLMYSFLVGLGLMLIIPGIYFGITMMFYTNSVAFSGKFGFSALRESMAAVRGRFWRTLLFGVSIWLLNGTANIALLNILTLGLGVIIMPLGGNALLVATIGAIAANIICFFFRIMSAMLFLNLFHTMGTAGKAGKSV